MLSTRATLSLALALATVAGRAEAYPFLGLRPGGTPFEGPADFEPSGIWWNPATISALRGWNIYFSGGLEARQGTFERTAIDPATGLPGAGASRNFPSQPMRDNRFRYLGAITWDFGLDVLTAGLAVSAPWDASQSFPDDRGGSSLSLPSQYHLASESFRSIFFSIAVALRLHPKWLVGVAISPVDSFADYTFYRDSALDGGSATVAQASPLCGGAACGVENPMAATRIRVRGNGGVFWDRYGPGIPLPLGIAMNWGLAFRPVERLWVGVSYQHVFPLDSHGSGYDKSYEVPSSLGAEVTPASGSGRACAGGGASCLSAGSIAFSFPDVFHLGVRILLREDLEMTSYGRLVVYGGYGTASDLALRGLVVRLATDGGAPEQIVMARGLRPTFGAESGLRWRPVPSLRLGLSAIIESGAVNPDLMNAEAIDAPKFDATVGAEWRARIRFKTGIGLRFQIAYGLTALLQNTPAPGAFDPGARVRCVDARASLDACGDDLKGHGLPTAAGRYSLLLHHLTVGVGLDF